MGLTLGISQFGSVINGWIIPQVQEEHGLGTALLIGFIVCGVSLFAALILCYLDRRADQYSVETTIIEEEKFKFRDIFRLGLSFWLLALSSLYIYMTVFPYMQNVVRQLNEKYKLDNREAAVLFGVPYIVSAVVCPILGLVSDKCGRRVQFIMMAHLILISAFIVSMSLPGCPNDEQCYYEFAPLLLIGFGYSIYISVFFGSIPLLVEQKNVGTAYGICQIFPNIALIYAPW